MDQQKERGTLLNLAQGCIFSQKLWTYSTSCSMSIIVINVAHRGLLPPWGFETKKIAAIERVKVPLGCNKNAVMDKISPSCKIKYFWMLQKKNGELKCTSTVRTYRISMWRCGNCSGTWGWVCPAQRYIRCIFNASTAVYAGCVSIFVCTFGKNAVYICAHLILIGTQCGHPVFNSTYSRHSVFIG